MTSSTALPTNTPPTLPGLPLVGNFLDVSRDPLGFLEACCEKYGRIFAIKLAGQTLTYVWMTEVLTDNGDNFRRTKGTPMERAAGTSILTLDGIDWKRLRTIAQPAFRKKSRESIIEEIEAPLQEFIERMSEHEKSGELVDLDPETSRFFFKFTCKAIFGASREQEAIQLTAAVATMLEEVAKTWVRPVNPPLWLPTPGNQRLKRAQQSFQDVVASLINERKNSDTERFDLLSLLLKANECPENGLAPLTLQELQNEVAAFLVGGYETTATSLMWTLTLIAEHPEVADAYHKQAAESDDPPLLEAIIYESLRLYPAAYALPRESVRDTQLAGYRIPAGSRIILAPYLTHRDHRNWPEPTAFKPERFLVSHKAAGRNPFSFQAFGLGPHSCVGKLIAMEMLKISVKYVLAHYDLSLPGGRPEAIPRVTLKSKTPCRIRLSRR